MTFEPGESTKGGGLRWMQTAAIVALIFVVGMVCVVLALKTPPRMPPKPFVLPFTANEVASMEVTAFFSREPLKTPFKIPAPYWKAVLAALLAAHEDDHPTKWEVSGDLEIKKKDGSPYVITFSHGGEFSVHNRVHYCGADGAALVRAVREGYAASQNKK
jgi:hypothetical protein